MSELDDYAWLTAPETALLLDELSDDSAPLLAQLDRLRKLFGPQRASLALEQVELRTRATAKFGELAGRMFFTPIGLQQSTDIWIAEYKAKRFPEQEPVLDYCSGIGGDLLGLAKRGPALGHDRSAASIHFATANLAAAGLADSCELRLGNVEDFAPENTCWHLDPDRRQDGKRSTQLCWHSPDETLMRSWLKAVPNGAIKLAPATEVPIDWQQEMELEWISRNRECRQLVAWSGSLAQQPGKRRATKIISREEATDSMTANSYVGLVATPAQTAEQVAEFVYDTDPAIRAAQLTGSLAADLGLQRIGAGECYLTSSIGVQHPLIACFQVSDVLGLKEKQLAAYLRDRGIGTLEIKKRGIEVDAERLRKQLKLKGDQRATLLLTQLGQLRIAIVAQRLE